MMQRGTRNIITTTIRIHLKLNPLGVSVFIGWNGAMPVPGSKRVNESALKSFC